MLQIVSSFSGLPPTHEILVLKSGPALSRGFSLFHFEFFSCIVVKLTRSEYIMAHEALISFKLLLQKMEDDLGLSDLSDVETKVFLAISDLCNQFDTAKTQAVLQHDLVASIGRETIFRAIKKLEDRNKISKSQNQHGAYSLAISTA